MPFYAPLFEKALLGFSPTPALSGFAYLRDCVYRCFYQSLMLRLVILLKHPLPGSHDLLFMDPQIPLLTKHSKNTATMRFCKTNFQSRWFLTGFDNLYVLSGNCYLCRMQPIKKRLLLVITAL